MSKVTEEELIEKAKGKRVTLEALKESIAKTEFLKATDVLTICIITLKNGFTLTGESACADPSNYNQDIGERLAYEQAEKKIWPLMGYSLRQELYEASQKTGKEVTFYDRLINEQLDLKEKLGKLTFFIEGNIQFERLDVVHQSLLKTQQNYMKHYLDTLNQRIDLLNPHK